MRFLVVEDFSTMRRILEGLLKEIGHDNADEAEDGGQALIKRGESRYDFAVTDINMPHMNGFELLNAIKSIPVLSHIPVLLVTAEARKAGARNSAIDDEMRQDVGGALKPLELIVRQRVWGSPSKGQSVPQISASVKIGTPC